MGSSPPFQDSKHKSRTDAQHLSRQAVPQPVETAAIAGAPLGGRAVQIAVLVEDQPSGLAGCRPAEPGSRKAF